MLQKRGKMKSRNVIELAYSRLSKSEKKAAQYILENEIKVRNMTLRELEREIGVSQPTIVRLVKSLGYEGFQDFKNILWMECDEKLDVDMVSPLDDKENIKLGIVPEIVSYGIIGALSEFVKTLNQENYISVIQWLHKAKTIDIYGAENSLCVADDLAAKLLHLGMCCRSNTDAFYQQIGAEHLSKKDVAIGISWTGKTKMTVDALQIAKGAGAKCIVITGTKDSPITKYADITFVMPSRQLVSGGKWITSRVIQIAFCDMLYAGLVNAYPHTYKEKLEKSGNLMIEQMYL